MTTDRELVSKVCSKIESRLVDPDSLDGLSEVEADLLASITAIGVIGNGGFAYWYAGKNTEETQRAALAFERLQLPEVSEALSRSLEAFPGGRPPDELESRQEVLQQHRDALDTQFDPLESVVYAADYFAAAASYIKSRKSELVAANWWLRWTLRGVGD